MIRNPAGHPGGDAAQDPPRGRARPSPWIVPPPGPSRVGTGMFPLGPPEADPPGPRQAGPKPVTPGYEFSERPRGRHRNGVPGVDLPPGRHQRRTHRRPPGRALRVTVPVTVIAFGVVSGLVVSVNTDAHRTPSGAASAFPPAVLAGQDFTPYSAASTRGITLSEGRVTSAGAEVVAVGAETGQLVPRAQFFVSPDDGRSWQLGTVTAATGGMPPPGHAARFVAGGAGEWAAVGPDSVWTSTNGRAWTLASGTGLPQQPGDQVMVLKQAGSGFIAAGANTAASGRSTPVIFLSAHGASWQRVVPAPRPGAGHQAGGGRGAPDPDRRGRSVQPHRGRLAERRRRPQLDAGHGAGRARRAGRVLRRGRDRGRVPAGQARDGGRRAGRRRVPVRQRHGLDVRHHADHPGRLHARPDEQ